MFIPSCPHSLLCDRYLFPVTPGTTKIPVIWGRAKLMSLLSILLRRTCLLLLIMSSVYAECLAADTWKKLEDGLELGTFQVNTTSLFNHSEITVLRVDPKLWDIKLYSIKQFDYKKG